MLHPAALNLPEVIRTHAKFRGNSVALIYGDRRITWSALNGLVNNVADALLARGLSKGDKVALLSLNGIEGAAILLGTMRAGGVIVPLSAMLTPPLLAAIIRDSGARFLFATSGLEGLVSPILEQLDRLSLQRRVAVGFSNDAWTPWAEFLATDGAETPPTQVLEEDEANIIYSSGTTGVPKALCIPIAPGRLWRSGWRWNSVWIRSRSRYSPYLCFPIPPGRFCFRPFWQAVLP
jgi:acyl-CoA synthetase (AMP-forming)/AMP-acid ligase II